MDVCGRHVSAARVRLQTAAFGQIASNLEAFGIRSLKVGNWTNDMWHACQKWQPVLRQTFSTQ